MYCINGKVSKNQFIFQLCIYINYFSKTSFYFKMAAVNVICFMELTNERRFIRIVYVVVWLSYKENDYGYFHNLEK